MKFCPRQFSIFFCYSRGWTLFGFSLPPSPPQKKIPLPVESLDWQKSMPNVVTSKNWTVKGHCGRCLSVWGPSPSRFLLGVVWQFCGGGGVLNLVRNRVLNSCRIWSPTQLNTPHPPPSHTLSAYTVHWLWEGREGWGELERRLEG